MKIYILLFSALLFLFSCGDNGKYYTDHSVDDSDTTSVSNYETIKIANYNIRYLTSADTGDRAWDTRKVYLLENIRSNNFDIFGTEEGVMSQLDYICTLSAYTYIGVGRSDGALLGEHSAIFYKKARFILLDKGDFWFSETPNTPSKGWDATIYRICSWGKFRDRRTQKTFYVFNSHFDNSATIARRESAKLLLEKIKSIAGNYPTFCTGDLNSLPDAEPMNILREDGLLSDAYVCTKTAPTGTFWTYNAYDLTLEDSPNRIDYIWVTSGITVNSFKTINDDSTYGRVASDHFPVMANVKIN